jgi:hypothetical protein
VIFWFGERLGGANYSLLNSLRNEYDEAKRTGIAPENYPFVRAINLATRLGVEEPTLRRRISRFRKSLNKCATSAGYKALPADAVIENESWDGYRLNPAVLVLAAAQLLPSSAVTSRKKRSHKP